MVSIWIRKGIPRPNIALDILCLLDSILVLRASSKSWAEGLFFALGCVRGVRISIHQNVSNHSGCARIHGAPIIQEGRKEPRLGHFLLLEPSCYLHLGSYRSL